ncbi:MAG: cell division protein FtsX [bacterium]
MIQSLLFSLKEGFGGLVRSKLTGFIATVTVVISLILVGIFLIVTINLGRLVNDLRSRVELEVFLDDSMDETKIQELTSKINRFEGVDSLRYISKDMAAEEFKQLFKNQQEDYFATLGYNPLPSSFRIKLTKDYQTASGAEKVFQYLNSLAEINEEDIVYRREYVVLLEKYIKVAIVVDFVIGIIICLSALLLVSNNIRLIISSKNKIIETMKLVGATRHFIKTPFYIQGIAQGLLGGVFSALFLHGLVKLLEFEISGYLSVDGTIYIILINLGVLLGFTGSFLAIRRYL